MVNIIEEMELEYKIIDTVYFALNEVLKIKRSEDLEEVFIAYCEEDKKFYGSREKIADSYNFSVVSDPYRLEIKPEIFVDCFRGLVKVILFDFKNKYLIKSL